MLFAVLVRILNGKPFWSLIAHHLAAEDTSAPFHKIRSGRCFVRTSRLPGVLYCKEQYVLSRVSSDATLARSTRKRSIVKGIGNCEVNQEQSLAVVRGSCRATGKIYTNLTAMRFPIRRCELRWHIVRVIPASAFDQMP